VKTPVETALRYLRAEGDQGATRAMVLEMAALLESGVRPGSVFRRLPLLREEGGIRVSGTDVILPGRLAGVMLEDCEEAVLLACTLGAGFDAMMRTWQRRDMARAAVLDACGSALTEEILDEAEKSMAEKWPDWCRTDRFSPGYGDLPLSLQQRLLNALDAERRVGITVNDSGLMIPQKSVTAVIGLSRKPQKARIRGCGTCLMRKNCEYRERGETCAV